MTRTYYDSAGRPVAVTHNCVGAVCFDPANSNPPAFSPAYPDRNFRSETRYDAAGRAFASIDALGRVTCTYYDAAGRAIATIGGDGKISRTYYDSAGRPWATLQNCVGDACQDPANNTPVLATYLNRAFFWPK